MAQETFHVKRDKELMNERELNQLKYNFSDTSDEQSSIQEESDVEEEHPTKVNQEMSSEGKKPRIKYSRMSSQIEESINDQSDTSRQDRRVLRSSKFLHNDKVVVLKHHPEDVRWEVEDVKDVRNFNGKKQLLLKYSDFEGQSFEPCWESASMTNCSELRLKIDKPKSTPKRKPKKRLIDIGKTEDPQKYIDFYQDLEKRLSRKRRRVMARKNFKKM